MRYASMHCVVTSVADARAPGIESGRPFSLPMGPSRGIRASCLSAHPSEPPTSRRSKCRPPRKHTRKAAVVSDVRACFYALASTTLPLVLLSALGCSEFELGQMPRTVVAIHLVDRPGFEVPGMFVREGSVDLAGWLSFSPEPEALGELGVARADSSSIAVHLSALRAADPYVGPILEEGFYSPSRPYRFSANVRKETYSVEATSPPAVDPLDLDPIDPGSARGAGGKLHVQGVDLELSWPRELGEASVARILRQKSTDGAVEQVYHEPPYEGLVALGNLTRGQPTTRRLVPGAIFSQLGTYIVLLSVLRPIRTGEEAQWSVVLGREYALVIDVVTR